MYQHLMPVPLHGPSAVAVEAGEDCRGAGIQPEHAGAHWETWV